MQAVAIVGREMARADVVFINWKMRGRVLWIHSSPSHPNTDPPDSIPGNEIPTLGQASGLSRPNYLMWMLIRISKEFAGGPSDLIRVSWRVMGLAPQFPGSRSLKTALSR